MTAFVKPTLYYNNVFRDAQNGDDGTPYATCAAASADVTDPFKIIGDIDLIPGLSALCQLISGEAVFATTGNRYHIIGAGGTNPTRYLNLYERLQDADVGAAFEVKVGLYSNFFNGSTCFFADPTRPIFLAADGHPAPRFKALTTNGEIRVRCHLPNYIKDGGFESGALSPNWTPEANWAIDDTTFLEGGYSIKWTVGDGSNNICTQTGTKKIEKDKTYILLCKAKTLTANATGECLAFWLRTASDGEILTTAITPTTTATWFSTEFTSPITSESWIFKMLGNKANAGSATAVIVDEIYLYAKSTVSAAIFNNQNLCTSAGQYTINAWRLSPLRITADSDANNKTQLYFDVLTGEENIVKTLAATNYPVYELRIPAVTGWVAEIGEMYLGDAWTLPRFPQPTDPYATGDGYLREMRLSFTNLPPAYRKLNIEDLFERLRQNEGIFVQWDTDAPILMEDTEMGKSSPYNPFFVDLARTFRERL